MTPLWTSADAERATGGQLQGASWEASGVSIDTRTISEGDLFVALKDVRDGHDFVADALAKGAVAALVSRVPEDAPDDASLLLVDDVLDGLMALGKAGRDRTGAQIIAITGSAGKTSTKEMLRHVLSSQGKTHAAEASYNNHWGVPLTLARMPADTEYAIIEIGMNAPGEIAPLSQLTRPNVAVVTTVAAAHLEAFESIEGIAVEKASIFEGLEEDGTAIFNADVETARILGDAAKLCGRRVSFGRLPGADLVVDDLRLGETGSVVKGRLKNHPFLFKLAAPGRHFAMNALAVYASASVVGADMEKAALDIGTWTVPEGRGRRRTLTLDADQNLTIELIDDAFNANPASMAAAFEVLAAIQPVDDTGDIAEGRRVAVLGDMLELGSRENALHVALADHPAMLDIHRVHCVGPRMKALYDALPEEKRGKYATEAETLAQDAHDLIDAGDVVLVKGSKGSRISLVAEALAKLDKKSSGKEQGT